MLKLRKLFLTISMLYALQSVFLSLAWPMLVINVGDSKALPMKWYCTIVENNCTLPIWIPLFPSWATKSFFQNKPSCTNTFPCESVCWSSNWTNSYTKPTTNLCANWTASSVAWTWPWTRWCSTIYNSVSCSANKKIDWVCWSADWWAFANEAAVSPLCSAWTPSTVVWSSLLNNYVWSCNWINAWTSASCSATKLPCPVQTVDGYNVWLLNHAWTQAVSKVVNWTPVNWSTTYNATATCNNSVDGISNEVPTLWCNVWYRVSGGSCINTCTLNGVIRTHGQTATFTNVSSATCVDTCAAHTITRTCDWTTGLFGGDTSYTTPSTSCTNNANTQSCAITNGVGSQSCTAWSTSRWSCNLISCITDFYDNGWADDCVWVGIGYYSPNWATTRTACTNLPDNASRDYTYTSVWWWINNCSATYTDKCWIDLYETSNWTCSVVWIWYYSPANNNSRTACTNKPTIATYTSDGNGTNNCSRSCPSWYHPDWNSCAIDWCTSNAQCTSPQTCVWYIAPTAGSCNGSYASSLWWQLDDSLLQTQIDDAEWPQTCFESLTVTPSQYWALNPSLPPTYIWEIWNITNVTREGSVCDYCVTTDQWWYCHTANWWADVRWEWIVASTASCSSFGQSSCQSTAGCSRTAGTSEVLGTCTTVATPTCHQPNTTMYAVSCGTCQPPITITQYPSTIVPQYSMNNTCSSYGGVIYGQWLSSIWTCLDCSTPTNQSACQARSFEWYNCERY